VELSGASFGMGSHAPNSERTAAPTTGRHRRPIRSPRPERADCVLFIMLMSFPMGKMYPENKMEA
jgi:hypothetical protein